MNRKSLFDESAILPEKCLETLTPNLPEAESDEALMARLADNEPGALNELVDRYSRVISSVVYNVVRNEAESEEVVMDVFYHSWTHASQYSVQKGKPLGWLVTMARRRGIDRLRKRQRYSRATERLESEVKNDPSAWVAAHDASEDAERSDLCTLVREKVKELPPFQQQAIEYTFYKGMSQREIAAATGIPLGTVKTRIELGLKKLAGSLQSINREISWQ